MFLGKRFILVIFGLAIFYLVFALYSDLELVVKSLISINVGLLPLVILFFILAIFVKVLRQQFLLRANEIKIPFKENMMIFFSGLSLTFTPGGMGELIKSKFFKEIYDIPIKKTLSIITIEKYHEFLSIASIIGFTILFFNLIEAQITLVVISLLCILFYVAFRYEGIGQFFLNYVSNA